MSGCRSENNAALNKHDVNGSSFDLERTRHYLIGKLIDDSIGVELTEILKTVSVICETIKSGYLNCS